MKRAPPRMEQFTAISGKKIPKAPYNAGENRSTTISTNCTIEAMTAMKRMKLKKLKSIEAYSAPSQVSAPSFKT